MKLDAYRDIIKNLNHINKKYHEIENKKIVSDSELIKKLPNQIFVPDQFSNNTSAKIFNQIISGLSKIVKYFI